MTLNQTQNSGGNQSSGSSGIVDTFYKDLFVILCYSLIVLVSLLGNILVLKVIASHQKYRTTTNILIASLATADLLTTTLNIPFNVTRFLSLNYPFGDLICKLIPFAQVTSVYVSTLTMAVIAIHRCMTLSSYRFSGSTLRVVIVIVVVWLISALFALPHSMYNQTTQVRYLSKEYTRCRANFPVSEYNIAFLLSVEAFFTQYLIPLIITGILYIWIGFTVSRQNCNNNQEQSDETHRKLISSDRIILNQLEAKPKSIITQLGLVVLAFALCWLPLNGYHLLVDFRVVKPNFTIFLFCHWIAMSSVCWNPFIYCWWNESFRKSVIRMLTCCCKRSSSLDHKSVQLSEIDSAGSD